MIGEVSLDRVAALIVQGPWMVSCSLSGPSRLDAGSLLAGYAGWTNEVSDGSAGLLQPGHPRPSTRSQVAGRRYGLPALQTGNWLAMARKLTLHCPHGGGGPERRRPSKSSQYGPRDFLPRGPWRCVPHREMVTITGPWHIPYRAQRLLLVHMYIHLIELVQAARCSITGT